MCVLLWYLVDADANLGWLLNAGVRLHKAGAVRLAKVREEGAKVEAKSLAEGKGNEGEQKGHRGQKSAHL